jgi:hypothetical protein
MEQIEDPKDILELFRVASKENFWGSLLFSFQNGKLVMVKKEETTKVQGGLDFSQ